MSAAWALPPRIKHLDPAEREHGAFVEHHGPPGGPPALHELAQGLETDELGLLRPQRPLSVAHESPERRDEAGGVGREARQRQAPQAERQAGRAEAIAQLTRQGALARARRPDQLDHERAYAPLGRGQGGGVR